jgi:hypothetical protein
MNISCNNKIPISDKFIQLLETVIQKSGINQDNDVIINFRDVNYGPEGGYHPVEVMVSSDGRIQHITDFAYVGGQSSELVKELDWDISRFVFTHMGHEYYLQQGDTMFHKWQQNFLSYYNKGVFRVTISSLS